MFQERHTDTFFKTYVQIIKAIRTNFVLLIQLLLKDIFSPFTYPNSQSKLSLMYIITYPTQQDFPKPHTKKAESFMYLCPNT